jgi:hypothetical protein
MTGSLELKKQLHQICLELILQRIENAEQALQSAREAAHEETKSSAGDKYETGRAMMQQEQQKHEMQLFEAIKMQHELAGIDPNRTCEKVEPGSLAVTNHGTFFIAAGLGKIKSAEAEVYAISLASPVGKALNGKLAGETFMFQGKEYLISQVV